MAEVKQLSQTVEKYKAKEAAGETDRIMSGAHDVGGVKVITAVVDGADGARLRQMGDMMKDKDPAVAAVLSSVSGGKITFLAVCGKDAVARGVKAGDIIKQVTAICGGKGGGKPDSAMGGGTDVQKLDEALSSVSTFLERKVAKEL
jgi:alanyl-tRNA synthetase